MELVLKQKIEDITPAIISFNNKELMAKTEAALKKYQGIIYTNDTMGEAKKDRADLNKFATALNSERLRIGKIYLTPYDKFKSEVDEVIGKVKEVVGAIDTQIKEYEDDKKAEKEEQIKELFNSKIGDFKDFITYEKVANAKWLNTTTTMKSIEQDIDTVIANATNAMAAIEALNAGADEDTIKAHYYRTLDLSLALQEHTRLLAERERIAAFKKQQEEAKKLEEEVAEPVAVEAHAQKLLVLNFKVTCTLEQAKGLKAYLQANNINYEAI